MWWVRGWCRDCWGPGFCQWGSLRPIWIPVKIPGVSGSWFSLLYQEFLCSKLASPSKVRQVHPSRRSQTSNNHPWRKWPGRSHHWTCVPRTRKKLVTDVYRSLSHFHDQAGIGRWSQSRCVCLKATARGTTQQTFEQALQARSVLSQSHLSLQGQRGPCALRPPSPG